MKSSRITTIRTKKKIRAILFLLFTIIIPMLISTPLFMTSLNNGSMNNEYINDELKEKLKLNAPINAHYFTNYKTITIDHSQVLGVLINFPFLISIFDTDLRFDVQSDGDDISFSYENTWIDHEIELFDQTYNGTHAKLVVWVRIPTLSTTIDTIIRMYYGNSTMNSQENPSGVWVNNYRGVWHLSESTGNALDSTTYSVSGAVSGTIARDENGKVDGAYDFGTNGQINFGDPADGHLDFGTGSFTISFWLKIDGSTGNYQLPIYKGATTYSDIGYDFETNVDASTLTFRICDGVDIGESPNLDIDIGSWMYITGVVDRILDRISIFKNGISIGSGYSISAVDNINNNKALYAPTAIYDLNGLLDEIRITSIQRSAGWILTEYKNQNDPNSFYTVGSEQLVAWTPPNAHYFMYYKIITIDYNKVAGTSSHTNFPVLISLIDENLRFHAQSDGDDIAFSMGGDWLDHEIELFDQSYSATQAKLVAWVKIPSLSITTNTIITMYYGNSTMSSRQNPTGVWSSNYVGVWHLSESSGGAQDSTSYATDGIISGGVTQGSTGQIDGTYFFNGIDSKVDMGDPSDGHLDFGTGGFTVETWIYRDGTMASDQYGGIFKGNGDVDDQAGWLFRFKGSDTVRFSGGDGLASVFNIYKTSSIVSDTWIHYVGVLDRSSGNAYIYKNGQLDATDTSITSGNINSDRTLKLSEDWSSSYHFKGLFDEIRILNVPKSSGWILTEYNNQYDPNSFYSIGGEQLVSDLPPNANYFDYYKIITINHNMITGIGSHLNFPFLISLIDEDLHYDVQNDGDDIGFAMDGKWLDHQIEFFDQSYSPTGAQLIAWIRIPFLSTAFDTNITMYYGNSTMSSRQNPTGVWGGYKSVWHFNEPSGTGDYIKDSTSNDYDGTPFGTQFYATGLIDGARSFSSVSDSRIIINQGSQIFNGENIFTFSFWIYPNYATDLEWYNAGEPRVFYKASSVSLARIYRSYHGPGLGSFQPDITFTSETIYAERQIYRQRWNYIAYSYDGTYLRSYINGTTPYSDNIGGYPLVTDSSSFYFGASSGCFKGYLDEFRVSNGAKNQGWLETEYNNQINPSSFYSIGLEQTHKPMIYVNAQINAMDLYGNILPNVTISIYKFTELIDRSITGIDGNVIFTNIVEGAYNFTATISSNIGNIIELVNSTSQAIMLDQSFQTINLICDVSTHFFELIDVDTSPVESGWIIVGNATHQLQKCVLDPTGHAKFWWINAPPSTYNYTIYYSNAIYNPPLIELASGDITTVNATIQVQVELTTIEFTIKTIDAPYTPVSGAKLKLTLGNPLGPSIVNLTTDINGQAILRWLTSLEIGGDYSLRIEFFGADKLFNQTVGGPADVNETSFTVTTMDYLEFRILIDLSKFQTELQSLNPTDYIEIEWGTLLTLRALFNVSKVEEGYESLLGPVYADSMRYDLLLGGITLRSRAFSMEEDNEGRHFAEIDTKQLESEKRYILIISAYKSGYTIPSDRILQLNILENEVELNQSNNDDSDISAYWLESVNMTLNSYGTNSETLTVENMVFQSINHEFDFLISDIETHWNLSKIILNFYNITWNTDITNINLTIEDPYGTFVYNFDYNNSGWDYTQGAWTGITLNLNRASHTKDNNFEFLISGTFDNTVDIIADAYFIRDAINVQYSQFNISSEISLLAEVEGWIISNVTFEIFDCYNSSDWNPVDLSTLTNLNITTNEGYIYSLDDGAPGTGTLIIDDRYIYPIGNQFLFTVESDPNIIFNAIIKVEYIQGFYKNQFLDSLNCTITDKEISNGGQFQVSAAESSWNEQEAILWVKNIKSGLNYFFPSELAMNITIGGQKYSLSDYALGTGMFSLLGFSKEQLLHAVIETSSPVNFTLLLSIQYSRTVSYEIIGSLSYAIVEAPSVSGAVQYESELAYYLKIIDTTLLDADEYTVRFTINNDHYKTTTKDLSLIVLNRPTLLNQSSEFFRKIESVYVKDAMNFTFVYSDALRGTKISNLKTQYYVWERYDNEGNVIESGYGDIISTIDNTYTLDFNTESRALGEYFLIVALDKDNYDRKNAMIILTIKKREIGEPILSDNFQDRRTSVVKGYSVPIQIILTDPTREDTRLLNATITLTLRENLYNFTHMGDGVYVFNFPTYNINAFFTSTTLTGTINITKEDYISQEFDIVIVVEMEQIFPGIPTFYFLLILSVAVALVGSIVGYRVYQKAKIPVFVRKVREMKKTIKKSKSIDESLLYRNKEAFIVERVNYRWKNLDLSLAEILNIKGEKIKKGEKLQKRTSDISKTHELTPIGLVLMEWNERVGTEILAKYPEETIISEKTCMQIYSTHEYSGEKGTITLSVGSLNIVSYYTGPEQGYYLLLILDSEDDPDLYEGGMADALRGLLQSIEDDSYKMLMPSYFQRLSLYPTFSDEEILALTYQDEAKRMIIEYLREAGIISKSELVIWFKDKYTEKFIDLEATLSDLLKKGIIKQISVKGLLSELIVLINDIFMLRAPPLELIEDPINRGLPTQFKKEYLELVKKFFQSYVPTNEDNLKIVKILSDPQIHLTLRLLRNSIVSRQDLEKLKVKGVTDPYSVVKTLWELQLIAVFQDEMKREYYALLSDFYIDLIFPKYLLQVIKTSYDQKSLSNKALIEYLEILEDVYYNLRSEEK
ncbi:MAG: DUF2341 domain-containing protein [Promethearchaeota archaeon]